jgi:DNA-directed RNA polymerase specialized sigma24 family protein
MIRTQESTPDCAPDSPQLLDKWLQLSLDGDATSRNRMLIWVHQTALEYYLAKVHVEALLTHADALDMASESVVEFERSWRRVRTVAHYCRRMFKNNLNRFLKRKRRLLQREQDLDAPGLESSAISVSGGQPIFEFDRFSDDQLRKLRLARRELDMADDAIRSLFDYRVFAGNLTYAEIGEILGTSETSLRMRMTRFNRKVRNKYAEQNRLVHHQDRKPSIPSSRMRGGPEGPDAR